MIDKRPTIFGLVITLVCVCISLMPRMVFADETTKPNILSFKLIPMMVKGKLWYQYHWEITNADRVRLFKNGKEAPTRDDYRTGTDIGWPSSMSSLRTRPSRTTTYRLFAENNAGENTSKEYVVDIKKAASKRSKTPKKKNLSAKIVSFKITPLKPSPGDFVKFHWDVKDANTVRLYDDIGEIDLKIKHRRSKVSNSWFSSTINETTTFRLEAYNVASSKVIKTFTVEVDTQDDAPHTCTLSGQLSGKWRQQIRERFSGPSSAWTVPIYIYAKNSNNAFAKADVNDNGRYHFSGLVAGQRYKVKPGWTSMPLEAYVFCRENQLKDLIFNITGHPRVD